MTERPNDERGGSATNVLVGSISATNVVLALGRRDIGLVPASVRRYEAGPYLTFSDTLQSFLQEHRLGMDPQSSIFAVAGTIIGDRIRVTNGRWVIVPTGIGAMLRRPPVLINDVSAVAWSILELNPKDLLALDHIAPSGSEVSSRRAVVWVGDGLGAACLAQDDGHAFVVDGEAGHMTCPVHLIDHEVCQVVHPGNNHISHERLLERVARLPPSPTTPAKHLSGVSSDVVASFAGNVTLAYGAWDGIFLSGPGIRHLISATCSIRFRDRFSAKGRFKRMLENVPIYFASPTDLPLVGAIGYLRSRGMC